MSGEQVECPVCGEKFSKQGLSGHLRMSHQVAGEEFDELYTEAVGDARGAGLRERRADHSAAAERMTEAPAMDSMGHPNLPDSPHSDVMEPLRRLALLRRMEEELGWIDGVSHERKQDVLEECKNQRREAREEVLKALKEKGGEDDAPDAGDRESEEGFLDRPLFGGLLSEEDEADE